MKKANNVQAFTLIELLVVSSNQNSSTHDKLINLLNDNDNDSYSFEGQGS